MIAKNLDIKGSRVVLLNNVAEAKESPGVFRQDYVHNTVQVINPDGATVKLWVSADGVNFTQDGDDITASKIVRFFGCTPWIAASTDGEAAVTVILASNEQTSM